MKSLKMLMMLAVLSAAVAVYAQDAPSPDDDGDKPGPDAVGAPGDKPGPGPGEACEPGGRPGHGDFAKRGGKGMRGGPGGFGMRGMRGDKDMMGRKGGDKCPPEMKKAMEEMQALVKQYREAKDDSAKATLKAQIKTKLEEHFTTRLADAKKRLEFETKRLEDAKKRLADREAKASEIISLRLDEMTRDPDLRW